MRPRSYASLFGAILLLVATMLFHQLLPYSRGGERAFAYLEPAFLLLTIGLAVLTAARRLFETGADGVAAGLLFSIALFGLDPYSYGRTGGHGGVQSEFLWQSAVTIALTVFLISATVAMRLGELLLARCLLVAEFLGFVILNGYYIGRDGYSRLFAGEYASPMPLMLLVTGILVRTVVHVLYGDLPRTRSPS